jgi:hypothetical protein
MVGLFFFIKASTKDRIQQIRYPTHLSDDSRLEAIKQYFAQRAYRIVKIDSLQKLVTFEGFVRPSRFLAIFLSFLAAIGLLCLSLIFSILIPQGEAISPWLAALSPLAGYFYWQQAGRVERVALQVESLDGEGGDRCYITVTAHRDELAQLQQAFPLPEASPTEA